MNAKDFYFAVFHAALSCDPAARVDVYCPDAPRPVRSVRLHPDGKSIVIELD